MIAITTSDARRKLLEVESAIAEHSTKLRALEGERFRLIRELTDLEGAHDQRIVAVR